MVAPGVPVPRSGRGAGRDRVPRDGRRGRAGCSPRGSGTDATNAPLHRTSPDRCSRSASGWCSPARDPVATMGRSVPGMLVTLGLISYGIYLIHAVVLLLLEDQASSLVPLPHGGAFAYVVHAALLLGLTLPLAWLSWRFFSGRSCSGRCGSAATGRPATPDHRPDASRRQSKSRMRVSASICSRWCATDRLGNR